MLGWKIRKIMKLKEVKNKAAMVTDHDKLNALESI
jgi:hypothetical protein